MTQELFIKIGPQFRAELEKIVAVYVNFSLVSNSPRQIKSGAYEGRIKYTDWVARLLLINHPN